MLQLKSGPSGQFKIKSIRKIDKGGKSAGRESACCPPPPGSGSDKPPCCGPPTTASGGIITDKVPGFIEWLETPAGPAPRISSALGIGDHLGGCKARWGIGRMNYIVPPGLYAIGCASGMINEWLRDHNLGKAGGSGCCS